MPYFVFPRSSTSHERSPTVQDPHPRSPPSPTTWFNPAVDRLICALDANGSSAADIIRRIKKQFPELQRRAITVAMIDRRLQVLDQNVDIDYFKYSRMNLESPGTVSLHDDAKHVEKQGSPPQVWKVGIDETGKKTEKPMHVLMPETSQRWEPPRTTTPTAMRTATPNILTEQPVVHAPSLKTLKKSKSVTFSPPSAWGFSQTQPEHEDGEHIRHIFESPLLATGSKY